VVVGLVVAAPPGHFCRSRSPRPRRVGSGRAGGASVPFSEGGVQGCGGWPSGRGGRAGRLVPPTGAAVALPAL